MISALVVGTLVISALVVETLVISALVVGTLVISALVVETLVVSALVVETLVICVVGTLVISALVVGTLVICVVGKLLISALVVGTLVDWFLCSTDSCDLPFPDAAPPHFVSLPHSSSRASFTSTRAHILYASLNSHACLPSERLPEFSRVSTSVCPPRPGG